MSYYVGKTKRELRMRIGEHIRSDDPQYPISRHTNTHGRDPDSVKFIVLDRVHPGPRGGDWDRQILQLESRWIYKLQATVPPGLNEYNNYKCFLWISYIYFI